MLSACVLGKRRGNTGEKEGDDMLGRFLYDVRIEPRSRVLQLRMAHGARQRGRVAGEKICEDVFGILSAISGVAS